MRAFLQRAWAWFVGAKPVPPPSEEYVLTVHPSGDAVRVEINCTAHQWLRHLDGLEPTGADVLAVEVSPDEIAPAREALVREADRLVRAIRAAWEHGWRPA